MKKSNQQKFATRTIHAGQEPCPLTGAIVTPVYNASTYVQDGIGKDKGFSYSRSGNPTRFALEACLANLDGAASAFALPSGLAAGAMIIELLDAGSEIVAHHDLYGGVYRLLADVKVKANGHKVTFVDFCDKAALEAAVSDSTAMMWFETPSNPTLQIVDIAHVVALAKKYGALSVCDSTFTSPYIQRPIEFGIDIVMHSATKFLNGHSDLMGGVVCINANAPEGISDRVEYLQNALGSIMCPTECSLLLRSIKTLHVRVDRHLENAAKIVEFLVAEKDNLGIEDVIYPGLLDHPGHELAKSQMDGFGALISLNLKGDQARVEKVLQTSELFQFAVSLGGVESLVNHPASLTHAVMPDEFRERIGVKDNMIRLSVGIEDAGDLIADLAQALAH